MEDFQKKKLLNSFEEYATKLPQDIRPGNIVKFNKYGIEHFRYQNDLPIKWWLGPNIDDIFPIKWWLGPNIDDISNTWFTVMSINCSTWIGGFYKFNLEVKNDIGFAYIEIKDQTICYVKEHSHNFTRT